MRSCSLGPKTFTRLTSYHPPTHNPSPPPPITSILRDDKKRRIQDRIEPSFILSEVYSPQSLNRRKKQPKEIGGTIDPEQMALRRNHSAVILASPIRMCQFTGVRVPSELLIPIGLFPHPTRKRESWMMSDYARYSTVRRYVLNSRKLIEFLVNVNWDSSLVG